MSSDFEYYSSDFLAHGIIFYYLIAALVSLTVLCVIAAARWKIYEKAGCNGWAALVPFYNGYTLYEVATGNGILFLLGFVPIVKQIMYFYIAYKLAKAFGKDWGYILGLIFLPPVFYCILGFGSANYIGPDY